MEGTSKVRKMRDECRCSNRQVGNRVSNVVVGHSQNWQLGNRARVGFVGVLGVDHAPRPLIDGGQIRVHVARIAAAAGHLFPRRAHFAQSVSVGGHVGENDQHVVVALVGQVPA